MATPDALVPPVLLHQQNSHAVYWLGIQEPSAFRCNSYLIQDGETALLLDPGGRATFDKVRAAVEQVLPAERLTGMVLCHQDPDVCASMVDWLDLNPNLTVFTTPRTQVLLPFYGRRDYRWYDVESAPLFTFASGRTLRFIPAPFLHFPGAFATFDTASGFLFSGDIWAALDFDWKLQVELFEDHVPRMDLFHTEYMASNVAARGFVRRVEQLPIKAILPQHGSILPQSMVPRALEYLRRLRCGLDLIYPQLQ